MTTQYTPILKLALPVTGELSGTWGDVVNDNITSMIEQAVAGLATINTWTTNAHTLTTANGTTSESRCAMLVAADGAGGTALTGAGEIICPAASKLYVLKNGSSYAVTLKTSAGSGVAVPSGDTAFLFCDGTNVNACVTTIVNGHISGNLTVDGNTTLGDANTDTVTVNAQFNTDLLPSTDNARDLGSTAKSWRTLYCDTSVLTPLVTATDLQVTNIKANDGTAAMSIADSTGAITVSTLLNVDNLRLDGNTLSSTDSNGNVVLAPNGTGDVQLDADTVRIGDSNANATITTNGTGDLILNTNAGTNSGSITIEDGVNGNIIIAPNGTGQVQITNAALDLTTIEVSNINAKDGTAAITIADSTGAVGISTAVTMSATTQNIALGTSQTTGTWTAGGASQTGALTLDQSTKTHTLNLGTGATESGLTKTVNIGTGGVSTSTTAITIGSTNGTSTTLNGTVTADTLNSTTIDTTNIEVTNIKAKDGTAALSIADSTGAVTVATALTANGGAVFNENGADVDFRVEGDTDANLIFADASTDRVGIGTNSPGVKLQVNGAGTSGVSENIGVLTGGASGVVGSGARLYLTGSPTAATSRAAVIEGVNVGGASNGHAMVFYQSPNSTDPTERLRLSMSEAVFNDPGNDYDFRVESDTNTHALFVDAGNSRVGINNASPTVALDVTGALTISGNAILGDASTDTVQVNGYMGVGGAGTSNAAVYLASIALTGTSQYGFYSTPRATSAATAQAVGFAALVRTEDAAFTLTNAYGVSVENASKGASSTITNQHGVRIADQTQGTNNFGITSQVSSGANKWNIYASGTAANYFAGNVGIGGTTVTDPLNVNGIVNLYAVNSGVKFTTGGLYGGSTYGDVRILTNRFRLYDAAGTNLLLNATTTEFVVNEGSSDYDFRVESDTNTHALFVQGSDGFVGIGTSSPLSTLHWVGGYLIGSGGTASNEARVFPAGYVLSDIGASVSGQKEIYKYGRAGYLTGGSTHVIHAYTPSAGDNTNNCGWYTETYHPQTASGAGNYFSVGQLTRGASGAPATQVERLRIDSSGNVGIGTSTPGALLELYGPANAVIRLTDNDGSVEAGSVAGKIEFNNLDTTSGGVNAYVAGINESNVEGSIALTFATGTANTATERLRIDSSGNVRVGTAALATTATDGFLYIPTCAGTPTGTPTAITGLAPMVIDSTNNKLYIYSGGAWVALN